MGGSGAGGSGGRTSWTGEKEVADYETVVEAVKGGRLGLASIAEVYLCVSALLLTKHHAMKGYSYGAMIASAVKSGGCHQVLISPPLSVVLELF